jgi:hypothetical protein
VTETTINLPKSVDTCAVHPAIETYQTWVDTLAGYMKRAADLLENLYAEQDQVIDQLRKLCARTHCLRHADFDAIFGSVLTDRRATRESLSVMVDGYRARREAVVQEVRDLFSGGDSDVAQAVKAWPDFKARLLDEKADGAGEIVAALRQVHIEQEKISTALTGLLMRRERLKIDDLKTVAKRLASRDSRDSAELAALLAVCESAGRNAGLKWRRLAG